MTHLTKADIIVSDIVGAIEEASHWRHDSTAWKEDENGSWAEFIQPMLDRVRAIVAEVEASNRDVEAAMHTYRKSDETAERRLVAVTGVVEAAINVRKYAEYSVERGAYYVPSIKLETLFKAIAAFDAEGEDTTTEN